MGLVAAALVLWSCGGALRSAELGSGFRAEDEGGFTGTGHAEGGYTTTRGPGGRPAPREQVPPPVFLLRLRVVDAVSGTPLSSASVTVYVDFTETAAAQTRDNGEAWFHIRHRASAVISTVTTKPRYVPALLPITTDRVPVFSAVTVALLGVNRGNMWLFNDSVLVTSKSTGVLGAWPLVHFPRSALTLPDDGALSSVAAFMNSPSLPPAEGALLHTMGLVSSTSGPVAVDLAPVASAFVQLVSDALELNVTGPVSLSLALSDSCGLQEGAHVPAWALDHSSGAWVRGGLGTVQAVEGGLVWTFAAPQLGHWMAAPLSPSRGLRLDQHVDFLLRHGSFLMMLLGSTLSVAVCLLLGLLCCPRSHRKDAKSRRPAVNPALPVKDQSTSTGEDPLLQNNVTLYDPVIANPAAEPRQTHDPAVTSDRPAHPLHRQSPPHGLFFYNQPVAILHAPAFLHPDEVEDWATSLPRTDDGQTKITNIESEKAACKQPGPPRAHGGLPESVSEPGIVGKAVAHGPRAWFVSLEGKPAAEIRYAVSEEQRRSRETSLDSGLDLTEPPQGPQGPRQVRLERNATFVKKPSK